MRMVVEMMVVTLWLTGLGAAAESAEKDRLATHRATPWLDGRHTVFGHVVRGQDVVDRIGQGDAIRSVDILRVGDKAKAFAADQAAFDAHMKRVTGR